GDLFSAWFKSNQGNYRLLRRHSAGARASTNGEPVFLIVLLVIVLAVVLTIAFAIAYMAYQMASILFGWSGRSRAPLSTPLACGKPGETRSNVKTIWKKVPGRQPKN